MSDEIFDAVMAETKAAEAQENLVTEAPTETPEIEAVEPVAEAPKEETFPKKAVNALAYKDKKYSKLEAKYQNALRELEEVKKSAPKGEAPKEDNFQTHGEYMVAVAEYAAEQKLQKSQVKTNEERVNSSKEAYVNERIAVARENGAEARKAFNDFDSVTDDAFSKLSPHVRDAFLEADNGAFALYALAKEGLVEDLNDMNAMKAAMIIARYEDKGLELSKPKKAVTEAPAPMSPSKGTAGGSKSVDQMSAGELLKWANS